jgi:hypothetical protein
MKRTNDPLLKALMLLLMVNCYTLIHGQERASVFERNVADSLKRVELKPVTVVEQGRSRHTSRYVYTKDDLAGQISVIGEPDVLRFVGSLPGVVQGMEGGLGYYVRGGNNSNNRILLDDVPVYGPTHLYGLFSSFHPDIATTVNFFQGGFPASTGDYLSSLNQLRSREPNNDWRGSVSLSPYMLGGSVYGATPDTTWGLVSAVRLSPLQLEYDLFRKVSGTSVRLQPQMGDAYVKVAYRPRVNHQLSLSGYYSNDYTCFDNGETMIAFNWNNAHVRAAWDYQPSPRFSFKTLAYVNHFHSAQQQRYSGSDGDVKTDLRMRTGLDEAYLSTNTHYMAGKWAIQAGLSGTLRRFTPAAGRQMVGREAMNTLGDTSFVANMALYSDIMYTSDNLSVVAGCRLTCLSGSIVRWLPDVHGKITYSPFLGWGLVGSYDRMHQTSHTLEGLPTGWSIDLMVPASNLLPPESAHQWYAGLFWQSGPWLLSSGAYYKTMRQLVSYINPVALFSLQQVDWRTEVTTGEGRSYGLETRLERTSGRLKGALSYTLSKTDRRFEAINEGRRYPFKFDRRHNLNFDLRFTMKQTDRSRQLLSAGLSYASGHYETIPVGYYEGVTTPYWNLIDASFTNAEMHKQVYFRQQMSRVNSYQLPDYIRVDLGYTLRSKGRSCTRELTLGVYNVLNRHNPYLVFFEKGAWQQLSLLPFLPSVQYGLFF